MGHSHAHEVAHFKRLCKHPDTCWCEVNRYLLASTVGAISASITLWIGIRYGSYGAESNAGHDYGDSLYILISAVLAIWKRYQPRHFRVIDDTGLWINSLFLIGFGGYVIYQLAEGQRVIEFKALPMFFAGFIALGGNYFQFRSLGQKLFGEGTRTHSSTRQHVLFDMLNAAGIMLAAALVFIMTAEVGLVGKCLVAMLLVYITAGLLLRLGLLDTREWDKGNWIDFGLVTFFIGVVAILLIVNGSDTDIDNVTGWVISVAMILGGLANLDDRYTKIWQKVRRFFGKGEEPHDHDHNGHHH